MFRKKIDILCIGDIATDAFIRLKDAEVHCNIKNDSCELCVGFGQKIPFEYVKVVKAVGNAANVAVASAKLGLVSALISDIGNDQNGKECLAELQRKNVITSFISEHKNRPTNYHFVLWYLNDRTILTNHTEYQYRLPKFPEPKWIYLTSIGSKSESYLSEIADYLDAHKNVKLAFQPGTYQLRLPFKELERIYRRTDVLFVNFEESLKIMKSIGLEVKSGESSRKNDIKYVLKSLSEIGPNLTIVTDGPNGAFMYDGDNYYQMPIYPDPKPALERTGCGDAWSATFVSALAMKKPPLEALIMAPINPMSVAQFVGSQEGLLDLKQLDWWLGRADQEYKPRQF